MTSVQDAKLAEAERAEFVKPLDDDEDEDDEEELRMEEDDDEDDEDEEEEDEEDPTYKPNNAIDTPPERSNWTPNPFDCEGIIADRKRYVRNDDLDSVYKTPGRNNNKKTAHIDPDLNVQNDMLEKLLKLLMRMTFRIDGVDAQKIHETWHYVNNIPCIQLVQGNVIYAEVYTQEIKLYECNVYRGRVYEFQMTIYDAIIDDNILAYDDKSVEITMQRELQRIIRDCIVLGWGVEMLGKVPQDEPNTYMYKKWKFNTNDNGLILYTVNDVSADCINPKPNGFTFRVTAPCEMEWNPFAALLGCDSTFTTVFDEYVKNVNECERWEKAKPNTETKLSDFIIEFYKACYGSHMEIKVVDIPDTDRQYFMTSKKLLINGLKCQSKNQIRFAMHLCETNTEHHNTKNLALLANSWRRQCENLETKYADLEAKCTNLENRCKQIDAKPESNFEPESSSKAVIKSMDEMTTMVNRYVYALKENEREHENSKRVKILEKKVRELNGAFSRKNDEIDRLKKQVSELRHSYDLKAMERAQKNSEEVKELEQKLHKANNALLQKNLEIERLKKQAVQQEQQNLKKVTELEQELREANNTCSKKYLQIEQLNKHMKEQDESISDLKMLLESNTRNVERLKSRTKEDEETIVELNKQLDLEKTICSRMEKMYDEEVEELNEKLKEKESAVKEIQNCFNKFFSKTNNDDDDNRPQKRIRTE